MVLSLHSRRLLGAATALACLLVLAIGADAASARAKARVAHAVALDTRPAGGKCGRVAASRARAASSRARPRAAARRIARRVRLRSRQQCLRNTQRGTRRKPSATPSVAPTAVSGNLTIGIDGGYTGWSDSEIEQRVELGAAVTRHEWDPAEAVDEQDDVVEVAAGTIRTRLHALLGNNELGDPNHYREWVIAFLQRYGVGGSFWVEHPELDPRFAITSIELGNEPYFGGMSAAHYADTVRPTLEEIRRLGLPVTVVLPSRVYGDDTSWMDTLYQRIPNLNELFHAFADHPYWYGRDPATVSPAGPFGRIETLRQRMNELGANAKPIWITEYGQSTANCGVECVGEAEQAAHLSAMIGAILSRPDWGVKLLSVFQLRDRGTYSGDRELQFGLLREDGTPKPSYGIVHGAMQQYRG